MLSVMWTRLFLRNKLVEYGNVSTRENREYLVAKTAGFKGLPQPYEAEALGLREAR